MMNEIARIAALQIQKMIANPKDALFEWAEIFVGRSWPGMRDREKQKQANHKLHATQIIAKSKQPLKLLQRLRRYPYACFVCRVTGLVLKSIPARR